VVVGAVARVLVDQPRAVNLHRIGEQVGRRAPKRPSVKSLLLSQAQNTSWRRPIARLLSCRVRGASASDAAGDRVRGQERGTCPRRSERSRAIGRPGACHRCSTDGVVGIAGLAAHARCQKRARPRGPPPIGTVRVGDPVGVERDRAAGCERDRVVVQRWSSSTPLSAPGRRCSQSQRQDGNRLGVRACIASERHKPLCFRACRSSSNRLRSGARNA
jgi:hypothetical protein